MPDKIHVFTTDEGEYGFSMVSPQLPGWVAVYDSMPELMRNYVRDLQLAGFRRGDVIGHHQVRGVDAAGQEYVVRWAEGEHQAVRREAAGRLLGILREPTTATQVAEHEPDRLGVINYVCCLMTDTVQSVIDQMDERGDSVVVVASVAESMMFGAGIATNDRAGAGWETLASLGIALDSRIGALMTPEMQHVKVTV